MPSLLDWLSNLMPRAVPTEEDTMASREQYAARMDDERLRLQRADLISVQAAAPLLSASEYRNAMLANASLFDPQLTRSQAAYQNQAAMQLAMAQAPRDFNNDAQQGPITAHDPVQDKLDTLQAMLVKYETALAIFDEINKEMADQIVHLNGMVGGLVGQVNRLENYIERTVKPAMAYASYAPIHVARLQNP
jgi:hypothetical protein